jgi:hypothetical protein
MEFIHKSGVSTWFIRWKGRQLHYLFKPGVACASTLYYSCIIFVLLLSCFEGEPHGRWASHHYHKVQGGRMWEKRTMQTRVQFWDPPHDLLWLVRLHTGHTKAGGATKFRGGLSHLFGSFKLSNSYHFKALFLYYFLVILLFYLG